MRIFVFLLAMITANAAFAACKDTIPASPEIMENVRTAMLNGDYRGMADASDPTGRIPRTQLLNVVNVLAEAHPNGFDFCEVLVRRQLSDSTFQEISVFSAEGKDWVFFYALGATINGSEAILNFKFSTSASEEFAKLR